MPARTLVRLLVVLSLLAALAVAQPASTRAATLTVRNLNDSGAGSLRQAIAAAAPGDTISFRAGLTGTITLTSGQLTITDDLTIAGPGAQVLAVSGNDASRVFLVNAGVTATIDGLTLRDGLTLLPDLGSAIRNAGTLALTRSIVTANSKFAAIFNDFGGSTLTLSDSAIVDNALYGIENFGSLTITRSTVAGHGDFGIRNFGPLEISDSSITGNGGDGIETYAPLTVTRSTLAGNGWHGIDGLRDPQIAVSSSTISGNGYGGIHNTGSTALSNSTIAFNQSNGLALSAPATVTGTIVAHNLAGNCRIPSNVTSGGYNLSSDATCFAAGGTDRINTGLRLGPLVDNGGPTLTHLPLPGSPAIEAGGLSCPATDQRGELRPRGAACDIGAVEALPPLVLNTLSPNRIPLSSTAQTLTIRGSNFATGATVTIGLRTYPAAVVSSTELRVSVLPKDVFMVGWLVVPTVKVTVVNPGGATSNSLTLYLAR
jgi:uncharacterized protein YkvS